MANEPKKLWLDSPAYLPEQNYLCQKHGSYRGRAFKLPFGSGKTIYPMCPECEKEAIDERNRQEAVRREDAIKRGLKTMNIGKMYWAESLETFDAYTPELKRNLEMARIFAKNPSGKLIMLGGNGTGKNHLAVSILREVGGVIYTAFEIGLRLRQSYGGDNKEWVVLGELCEKPLLVIDEIGRTKGSDFDLNWLSHVINKRHENLLPLILISNQHLKDDCPEHGCPKCLENFFDNDVISRIVEDGTLMKFTGEDYRCKKRALRERSKQLVQAG